MKKCGKGQGEKSKMKSVSQEMAAIMSIAIVFNDYTYHQTYTIAAISWLPPLISQHFHPRGPHTFHSLAVLV